MTYKVRSNHGSNSQMQTHSIQSLPVPPRTGPRRLLSPAVTTNGPARDTRHVPLPCPSERRRTRAPHASLRVAPSRRTLSYIHTHTHTHTPSHFSGSTPSTTRASHPSTSIVTTRWVGAVSCRAPGSTVTVRRCAKRLRVLATAFRRLLPLRKNLRRRHSALIACT